MPILTSLPDHFAHRPTTLGITRIVDNQYKLDRTQVDATEIHLESQLGWTMNFNKPNWELIAPYLSFSTDYLSPSFLYRIYLWISKEPNGNPLGAKILGQVISAPIVVDLQRSDTEFTISSYGTRRPMIRLDPGTYWVNLWYYGTSKCVYLSKDLTEVDPNT